ncbi:MAG: ABC transporter ATP-binding protein [Candidatus Magnetominusculus sp. LBB02]|nr:ABC transporter ATP-binding protein [Candidatus Magnetominusculus sp. LBB02]
MENAVEVSNLVTYYGDRQILKGVSLSIPAGMTTVIVGRSGCGKTTLLKHLIGLIRPTSGTILIHDTDITAEGDQSQLEQYRKKMGVLFQGAALLNSMTLAENVALPLKEHTKLKAPVIDIIVRMKLDLVGLSGFGDFYPAQLSGGMKKRAGIARAMAMDPKILYFDEPSAGLDPVTAAGLDELILRLHRVFKMTVIVVTHELPSIFAIADYVVMLDNGEVVFVGNLDDFKKSEKPIVKAFLERRPEEVSYSPDNYFKIITGT